MGATRVPMIVRHPTDPTRSREGRLLVDTGAIESVVPGLVLTALCLKPRATRRHELADGTVRDFAVATGELECSERSSE